MVNLESNKIENLQQQIKEECKQDIKSWNYDVNGILLKIKKAKTSQQNCEIFQESDIILVNVKCVGIFFIPQKCLLVGKIKFIKHKQIYLKIFGQFKGIINYQDISKNIFQVDEDQKILVNVEDDSKILKNMLIQFQCTGFQYQKNELIFYGEITDKTLHGIYKSLPDKNKCVIQKEQR